MPTPQPSSATWFLVSLGCAKNLVDSEALAGELAACGLTRVDDPAAAELIVINTCGFIAEARSESIDTILHYAQYKHSGACRRLAVVGCMVQRWADPLREALPEVDLFLGLLDRAALGKLKRFAAGRSATRCAAPPERLTQPHSAYLRIADGCANRCAYCSIPLIRGSLRSRPARAIVDDARRLADSGVREVSVIAQDIAAYGADRGARGLPALVRKLGQIDGLAWIRLMYLHPAHIDEALIDAIADTPRVVRYLDVPVQHGATRILKRMGRGITRAQLETLFDRLRQRLPGLFLRTTFLVGFPGETAGDFKETLDFAARVRFERFGVFTYSDEEGTRAIRMRNKVPPATATRRRRRLEALRETLTAELIARLQGQTLDCMVDAPAEAGSGELALGRTYGDAPDVDYRIAIDAPRAKPGDILSCRITGHAKNDLIGEPV